MNRDAAREILYSGNGGWPWIALRSARRRSTADGLQPPVYGATFYPGFLSKDKATLVQLAPGQNVTGIDIHLAEKRSVTLNGVVTGIPANATGIPFAAVWLSLSRDGHRISGQNGFTGPNGKFTFSGVTPEKYLLKAVLEANGAKPLESAAVEVDLHSDQTGVVLALVEGQTISGTVRIEGDAPDQPLREKLTVRLSPEIGQAIAAEVDGRGAFHLDQIFPDRFRVAVMPLPENTYVKSVKTAGTESADGMVELSRGVSGTALDIALSRNGGRVQGKVLDADGNPLTAPSAFVVLGTADGYLDDKSIQPVEADAKFEYSGLRPGKYKLIAADPDQVHGDRDISGGLTSRLAAAPEFEIHEGDRLTKDVKITTAETGDAHQ